MNARPLPFIALIATLLIVAALAWATFFARPQKRSGNNFLGNPPEIVDQLVMYDTVTSFGSGTFEGTAVDGDRIVLNDKRADSFPRSGTWTSSPQITPFPVTEIIPSWNVIAPSETGARFHVRVKDLGTGEWSPWLYIGQWGRTIAMGRNDRTIQFDGGEVQIDTLVLRRPASAFQIRATLQSFDYDTKIVPALRRVSICYSGVVDDQQQRRELMPSLNVPDNWARDLSVKFRAQADSNPRIKGEVCSPTSVSMVMEYSGVNLPTLENANAIFDSDYNLFGNWNRAVARAGELGLDAWITRFRNWDQVKATIAQGQPIVASIRFEKGEMPNNPLYQDTPGHLIVIRGLTKEGDVIVNDPARKEPRDGKPNGNGVVYKANELAKAWFDRGGVAYIIRKPAATRAPTSRPATNPTTRRIPATTSPE